MAPATSINFGIIGCANIAEKLNRAIALAPNANLAAVASRSFEKATLFAKSNNLPSSVKLYGSYESLFKDPQIDAVYIPLPTGLHAKWACLAANSKKHILIEKPVALNVADFDKIIEACESNGVQLMDGTQWMHHPRTRKMEDFLRDKDRFGSLKTVQTIFTFDGDEDFLKNDIRVKPDLDGLGALGDIGWYCTRSILWAANYELPKRVAALRGPVLNSEGVILSCSASMEWEDGKTATFHCSFLSSLTMEMTVVGKCGTLKVSDFVIPFDERECSFKAVSKPGFNELVTGWLTVPSEHVVFSELPQEACMVMEFARLVTDIKENGGKPDQSWASRSRKTQVVVDAVKASIERDFEPVELEVM